MICYWIRYLKLGSNNQCDVLRLQTQWWKHLNKMNTSHHTNKMTRVIPPQLITVTLINLTALTHPPPILFRRVRHVSKTATEMVRYAANLQGTESVSSASSRDQKLKLCHFLKLLLSQLIFQTEKQTELIFSQAPEILKIGQIHQLSVWTEVK